MLVEAIHKQLEKDDMLLTTCFNHTQKEELIRAESKKMQQELLDISPKIASFLTEYIRPFELEKLEGGYGELRVDLIRRFVMLELQGLVLVLIKDLKYDSVEKIQSLDFWFWESVFRKGEHGIDNIFVNHFVESMVVGHRLNSFLGYMEIDDKKNDSPNNETHTMFLDLQAKESSNIELYQLVKEKTDLDATALQYFKKDIEMYLFYEKDELSVKYSKEDVAKALKELREVRGYSDEDFFKLGIYRKPLIGDEKMKNSIQINREKLLYPFEFDNIELLLNVVNAELKKQGVVERKNYLKKTELQPKENVQLELSYPDVIKKINDAFFRLESFMNGTLLEYKHFNFDTAFTELFNLTKKHENYTPENCKRIGQYWVLTDQIRVDYDKSDFINTEGYDNKDFCHDCEEVMGINWERIDEFLAFSTHEEIEEYEKKKSISDIIKYESNTQISNLNKEDTLSKNHSIVEKGRSSKINHHSFKYKKINTSQSNLTDLLNSLKRVNLVHKETILKDFRKVFNDELITRPIVWTGNVSELYYFIKRLHNDLKYVDDLKKQQWGVAIKCFIQADNTPYDRRRLSTQKPPSTAKRIDKVLNTLK